MTTPLDPPGGPSTGGVGTLPEERTDQRTDFRPDEGDHERFSHYVPKDELTEAMVMGTPVVALCGKVWVPSRDPQRFPVCPECKEIWDSMPQGGGKKGGRRGGAGRGNGGGGSGDGS